MRSFGAGLLVSKSYPNPRIPKAASTKARFYQKSRVHGNDSCYLQKRDWLSAGNVRSELQVNAVQGRCVGIAYSATGGCDRFR